jgi:putative ATP-grasp target RiPP
MTNVNRTQVERTTIDDIAFEGAELTEEHLRLAAGGRPNSSIVIDVAAGTRSSDPDF